MKKYRYNVENLDCANCAKKIEDKIASIEGYSNVVLNYSTLKLSFETEKENPLNEIKQIIAKIEPEVQVKDVNSTKQKNTDENKLLSYELARIIIGIFISVLGFSGIFKIEIISKLFIITS